MIKVMILCNSLNTAQKITNKVVASIEKVKIVGIATTFEESKSIISNYEPDLIITTNTNIFDFIEENFVTYSPGIAIISNLKAKNFSYRNLLLIDYQHDFKTISKEINNFIKESLSITKKEKAIKILSYVGFDFKLSSTNYLLDSILYANSYKGSYSFETVYYDIYSYVAELNNTNCNIIKWSIARSINYLYNKGDKLTYERIEKYFGIEYPEKLTPKFLINYISNKLNT